MSTTRDWLGGTHGFFAAGSWSPAGRPVAGDTLIIGPGTSSVPNVAVVRSPHMNDLTVLLDDGSGSVGSPYVPTLSLVNTTIGARTLIENQVETSPTLGASDTEDIQVSGEVRNEGTIAENPGAPFGNTLNITLSDGNTLVNGKSGTIAGTTISNLNIEGGAGTLLINNGTVTGQGTTMDVGVPVVGNGSFSMSGGGNPGSHTPIMSTLTFHATVGSGQAVALNDTTLVLDQPMSFLATIDDLSVSPNSAFSTNNSIVLAGEQATGFGFQDDTLTVQNGQQTLAQLHFTAGLTAADFSLANTSQGAQISIVAPAGASPQVFAGERPVVPIVPSS
jgi:hypothetical protein